MNSLLRFFCSFVPRNDRQVFRVVSVGRDELKYIEGHHELLAQVELQSGKPERIIYSSTVRKWLPPYDQETISLEKRNEIISRLADYFKRQNVTCDVT